MAMSEAATESERGSDRRGRYWSFIASVAMVVIAAGLIWVWYDPHLLGFRDILSHPQDSTQGVGVAGSPTEPAPRTVLSDFAAFDEQRQLDVLPLRLYELPGDSSAVAWRWSWGGPLSQPVEPDERKRIATEQIQRRRKLRELVSIAPSLDVPCYTHVSTLQAEGLKTIVILDEEVRSTVAEGMTPTQLAPGQNPVKQMSRSRAKSIQEKLLALGYAPGPADGVMGRKTRDAIRRFQQDHGLPETGEVTDALLVHLEEVGR